MCRYNVLIYFQKTQLVCIIFIVTYSISFHAQKWSVDYFNQTRFCQKLHETVINCEIYPCYYNMFHQIFCKFLITTILWIQILYKTRIKFRISIQKMLKFFQFISRLFSDIQKVLPKLSIIIIIDNNTVTQLN